jgi:hypothetical protein
MLRDQVSVIFRADAFVLYHANILPSLAQAEMYIVMATVFSRFEFQLYDTDASDVEMAHAYLLPTPKGDSKGVRAIVRSRST